MIPRTLITATLTAALTACGGSTGSSGGNSNGDNSGNNEVVAIGGQSGAFGDAATADNGMDASATVCPASITGSFTGWAENGNSWCVWACPSTATVVKDNESDEWGFISSSGQTCRDTTASAGTTVVAPLFAAINGCPDGGCTDGSTTDFPRVLVTIAAGESELAGTYTCGTRTFDGGTDLWSDLTNTFSLTLPADSGASWSFDSGVLTIEAGDTYTNVAVGTSGFTSWNSNTSHINCSM